MHSLSRESNNSRLLLLFTLSLKKTVALSLKLLFLLVSITDFLSSKPLSHSLSHSLSFLSTSMPKLASHTTLPTLLQTNRLCHPYSTHACARALHYLADSLDTECEIFLVKIYDRHWVVRIFVVVLK